MFTVNRFKRAILLCYTDSSWKLVISIQPRDNTSRRVDGRDRLLEIRQCRWFTMKSASYCVGNAVSLFITLYRERLILLPGWTADKAVCLRWNRRFSRPVWKRERERERWTRGEEEGKGRRDRCRTSAASNYYRMFANRIDLRRPDFSFPVYRWKWWTSWCKMVCAGFLGLPWEALICIRMMQNILEDCRVDGGNRSIRELYV